MKFSDRSAIIVIIVLAINHLVGAVGLNTSGRNFFEELSWLNLLISFSLVIWFHPVFDYRFFLFAATAFFIGMAAEIAGVHTGFPFGVYSYSDLFGQKVFNVPLIIGMNWVLLSYVSAVIVSARVASVAGCVIGASLTMVVFDLLLEPFAIRHHFWHWEHGVPPLQNYLSWFAVSVPIQFVFRKNVTVRENPLALPYALILMLFLAADFALGLFY